VQLNSLHGGPALTTIKLLSWGTASSFIYCVWHAAWHAASSNDAYAVLYYILGLISAGLVCFITWASFKALAPPHVDRGLKKTETAADAE